MNNAMYNNEKNVKNVINTSVYYYAVSQRNVNTAIDGIDDVIFN